MIFESGKKYLFFDISSRNIDTLVPSLYQCVETRSIEVFWLLLSQPLPHLRFNLFVISETFATMVVFERIKQMGDTLPTVNRNRFLMNILSIESFCTQKKTHNRTLLFGSILKNGRHFDYWNQPLNMRMDICYLDRHETGLCCYLVRHIENLSHQLQMFQFNLWPICWLSLLNM
jgi:hypothetical protein